MKNSLNNENFSEASSTLNAYSKENIMSSLAERDLGYSMLCLRLGLKGCGYISDDFPSWIEIDWEATAENVKQDYSELEYEGETYFYRA